MIVAMIAGLLMLGGCAATGAGGSVDPVADGRGEIAGFVSPAEFLAFLDNLEGGLKEGEPRQLSSIEMRQVEVLCNELRGLLDGVSRIESLNPNQRAMIFNKSEELWAVVSGNRAEQVVCRRERQVGTNFQRTRCRTVRELRREDREADLFLRKLRGSRLP